MATPLAIGDKIRVVIGCYFPVPKQLGETVVHYRCVDPGGFTLEDFATAMKNRMKVPFCGWMHNTAQFQGVSVQRLFPGSRTSPFYVLESANGTAPGVATLPGQVSGLCRYRTEGIAGTPGIPALNGRSYVSFPSDYWQEPANGRLNSSGFSALEAVRTKLGPDINFAIPAQFKQVVYSRTYNGFFDVTSSEGVDAWATQKRRGSFGTLNQPFGT
jgi:hypothetical protein